MLNVYRSQSLPVDFKRLLNQSKMILTAQIISVIEVIIKKLLMMPLKSNRLKSKIGTAPKSPKSGAVIRAILVAFQ